MTSQRRPGECQAMSAATSHFHAETESYYCKVSRRKSIRRDIASRRIAVALLCGLCFHCFHVKKRADILQETLLISIKHDVNTRPWTSAYRRAHSANACYVKLSEKLTERFRLPLLAAEDKRWMKKYETFLQVVKNFLILQYSTGSIIHLVVPSY